jgi:putative transposase
MAMWRLYYHLVWATKERQPLISSQKETELYHYIIGKADTLNCIVHAIGGTENHIHLIVSIPPTQSIAEFVKNIKGSSSHYLNQIRQNSNRFGWQEGYGVFSLGQRQCYQSKGTSFAKHRKFAFRTNHRSRGSPNPLVSESAGELTDRSNFCASHKSAGKLIPRLIAKVG